MSTPKLFLSGAAFLAAMAAPALAQDEYPADAIESAKAERLEAMSSWNLDYGAETCRLVRLFGAEDDRHALMIDQASPGRQFMLTLAGSSFSRFRRGDRAHLGMQNDVPMHRFDMPPTGDLGEFGPAIILSGVGLASEGNPAGDRLWLPTGKNGSDSEENAAPTSAGLDVAEAAKVDRIVIKRGGRVVSLETGNLAKPFEALNECTDNMLREWGLDPAKHKSFTPVRWTNQDAITRRIVAVYPRPALNRGEQAIFRMHVIVDKDGSIADCTIAAATRTERLDSPACNAMMGAQFEPALDAHGQPMKSFYTTSISYRIAQ